MRDEEPDHYEAARFLSRCVPLAEKDMKWPDTRRRELARGYAERALALLRLAMANGYKDTDRLQKASDLDPLRQRPDFQQLLAELQTKKRP